MKYKTLDDDAQKQALLTELNRLESEHIRLVTQDPDPEKDTAGYQQQKDLERRIKSLQDGVKAIEDGDKPKPTKPKATKKAAPKASETEADDDK